MAIRRLQPPVKAPDMPELGTPRQSHGHLIMQCFLLVPTTPLSSLTLLRAIPLTVAVSSRDGQSLIIIGGYNPEGILSDAWEFHLERREWDRVYLSTGASPPERAYFRG